MKRLKTHLTAPSAPPPDRLTSQSSARAKLPGAIVFAWLSAVIVVAITTLAPPAVAKQTKTPPQRPLASQNEVTEKQGDLKELRGQIDSLRKEVAEAEGKRANTADQLKGVEQEISSTQRELHSLSSQKGKLQETLKDLGHQSRELETRLAHQQAQLDKLVYRQYVQGNPDTLQILLNGNDPNQVARDLHYLSAIGNARSELLQEIKQTLQQKQTLTHTTRERTNELSAVEYRQREQHGKLLAQRQQRKQVLEKISAKIAEQRREIGNLQRDEKRLSQLIERLSKILAERQAQQRKESRANAPKRQAGQTETRAASSAPELSNDNTPEASASNHFAQLRGSLRLPARGAVTNRFGAARSEGGTWKGLFIRAASGSEIRAIASGRVVFADWMRGFGNLLIIDHGDSYLSIYGNNDALLKQVGDRLRGGEVVASAGNSGGNPESGLYFELRHQGQPIDPLKWVSLK